MEQPEGCQPGRRATVSLQVSDADTAIALGTGDVPVLATPRALALAEQAAVQAIAPCFDEDRTTVGAKAEIEHTHPSFVGQHVEAEAVLLGVHGRRLEFAVTLRDEERRQLATVRHERVMVDRARFSPPEGSSAR